MAKSWSERWSQLIHTDNVGCKFLHAVDSLVTIGAIVKGGSSSLRLKRIVLKAGVMTLAVHLHPSRVYVRSHENPAEQPSRAVREE